MHRLLEQPAGVKSLQLERRLALPDGLIRPVADRPVLVIGEAGDHLRQFLLRRLEWLAGPLLHHCGQLIKRERCALFRAGGGVAAWLLGDGRGAHEGSSPQQRLAPANKESTSVHVIPAQIWRCAERCAVPLLKNPGKQSAELEKVEARSLKFRDETLQKMMRSAMPRLRPSEAAGRLPRLCASRLHLLAGRGTEPFATGRYGACRISAMADARSANLENVRQSKFSIASAFRERCDSGGQCQARRMRRSDASFPKRSASARTGAIPLLRGAGKGSGYLRFGRSFVDGRGLSGGVFASEGAAAYGANGANYRNANLSKE